MQLNSALACVKIPTGLNFGPVALVRLETWITAPEMGGDEWGHVKSMLIRSPHHERRNIWLG